MLLRLFSIIALCVTAASEAGALQRKFVGLLSLTQPQWVCLRTQLPSALRRRNIDPRAFDVNGCDFSPARRGPDMPKPYDVPEPLIIELSIAQQRCAARILARITPRIPVNLDQACVRTAGGR